MRQVIHRQLSAFYQYIDAARNRVRGDTGSIAAAVIFDAFPETVTASKGEGCERIFFAAVQEEIRDCIKKPKVPKNQLTWDDVPGFLVVLMKELKSEAFFVPDDKGGGELVDIGVVVKNLPKLDLARKYLRKKGDETLAEATRLDGIYFSASHGDAGEAAA